MSRRVALPTLEPSNIEGIPLKTGVMPDQLGQEMILAMGMLQAGPIPLAVSVAKFQLTLAISFENHVSSHEMKLNDGS